MCDECLQTLNPNNHPACVRCGHLARDWTEIDGRILCEDCESDEIYERKQALKKDLALGEIIERDISRIEQQEISEAMEDYYRKNGKGNA